MQPTVYLFYPKVQPFDRQAFPFSIVARKTKQLPAPKANKHTPNNKQKSHKQTKNNNNTPSTQLLILLQHHGTVLLSVISDCISLFSNRQKRMLLEISMEYVWSRKEKR